jgi:two-component system, cell cycle response regulator DivK
MRILYVEDNQANLFLVQRVARMGGHEVITYSTGESALANFETDKPNLILMDIQLSGELTGLDVVKKLRASGYVTPVVAVTAYAMVGDREKCMEAGCDAYLSKPLPVTELVEIIRRYEAQLTSPAAVAQSVAVAAAIGQTSAPAQIAAEQPVPTAPEPASVPAPAPSETEAAVSPAPSQTEAVTTPAPTQPEAAAAPTPAPVVESPVLEAKPEPAAAKPETEVKAEPVAAKTDSEVETKSALPVPAAQPIVAVEEDTKPAKDNPVNSENKEPATNPQADKSMSV